MTITRRTLIKQLMLGAGAAALLPSCVFEKKEAASDGSFLLSEDQNKLIAEIAETIIPKTSTPGAKDLKVEEFIHVMATDCFDHETQDKFSKGLAAVDALSEKRFGDPFIKITPAQRNELFSDISTKKEGVPAEVIEFFPLIKGLTLRGYMASEYIMTEVKPWLLVPGPSKGCVEVKAA
ncbi:MAG: hypothetical protein C0523_03000 [Cytophaga sp.]|nr:hypothetical protein [Cytophaga sp.]